MSIDLSFSFRDLLTPSVCVGHSDWFLIHSLRPKIRHQSLRHIHKRFVSQKSFKAILTPTKENPLKAEIVYFRHNILFGYTKKSPLKKKKN